MKQGKSITSTATKKLPRVPALVTVTMIFAIGLTILIANKINLYRNMGILKAQQEWVMHTRLALDGLERIILTVRDAESSARGYFITAQPTYLEPYDEALRNVPKVLQRAKDLMADNPSQLTRLARLEEKVHGVLNRQAFLVELTRKSGPQATALEMRSGISLGLMRDMRAIIDDMREVEQRLLDERIAQAKVSSDSVDKALVISTIANVLILLIAYYFIRRDLILQALERLRLEDDAWLKQKMAELSEISRGNETETTLGAKALSFFATHLNVPVGTLYTFRDDELRLRAVHAGDGAAVRETVRKDEGLTWAAASQGRIIYQENLPDSYLKVSSSLGDAPVRHLVIIPLLFEKRVKGVMELGSLEPFRERDFKLFDHIEKGFGVSIDAAQSRSRTQELLEETQAQAEELQAQQEELRANNEELQMQAESLKTTQDRLRIEQANLERINDDLQRKATELSQASAYKSEFLANMSHELRTPLNSLLILATLLYENEDKNLTEKQIEFAKTIYRSGTDLLGLINDILDLSKVEAGKLEIQIDDISLEQMGADLERLFKPLATQKSLTFALDIAPNLPGIVRSDRQRVEQILKNFLSNALKFTARGGVRVAFERLNEDTLALRVTDTGIGISADKQSLIFDAFQQADGSISRQFGGTGLGLTISRELAQLLRGRIELASVPGKGSVFSLIIPITIEKPGSAPLIASASEKTLEVSARERHARTNMPAPFVEGDLETLHPGDRTVVIVEDDVKFGRILLSQAHEAGFKALLTNSGEAALELIDKHNVHGVLLDLRLPDISGLSLLERLKSKPTTRHLPTHIISAHDFTHNALKMGAMGYLVKPVTRAQIQDVFARLEDKLAKKIKHVLVIEDDKVQRDAMVSLLSSDDIQLDAVGFGGQALQKFDETSYDCIILDLRLPDMSGFDLLEALDARTDGVRPPVIIYTGKDLSKSEIEQLRRYSESIVLKGAKSPERLLDEVSLFLHRVETDLPASSQAMLRDLRSHDESFKGRKILLVDDDMRNIFALANMLQSRGMEVVTKKNGQEAVDAVREDASLDLVLMDIMMPLMNGYEAMEKIRLDHAAEELPIIALTAKAMKGDQDKCLAAGANDYLAKPVNPEQLLSLLRVWLPKRNEI